MSKALYPNIATFRQEWFKVAERHQIYIEQSGNPNGIAVIYLHGGPGGGSSKDHRRYFDPEVYRIILIDQRGCGRSKPSPTLKENTSLDLIADLEKIRHHLGVDKWLLAGGSWGTTLALLYGIKFPETVLGFILRGVFLGTEAELNWLYSDQGAALFFPEYYRDFISVLSEEKRVNVLKHYYEILTGNNEVAAIAASKAWCLWELRLSTLEHHHIEMNQIDDAHQALCMAKISAHYFNHSCFIAEDYIFKQIGKITHLPAIILHGRYDMVCQVSVADKLTRQWANAQLQILPRAGHSGFESQTIDGFCKAADTMAAFIIEQGKLEI